MPPSPQTHAFNIWFPAGGAVWEVMEPLAGRALQKYVPGKGFEFITLSHFLLSTMLDWETGRAMEMVLAMPT